MSSSTSRNHCSSWNTPHCCRQVDGVDMTGGGWGHTGSPSLSCSSPKGSSLAGSEAYAAKSPLQCHPTTQVLFDIDQWYTPIKNTYPLSHWPVVTIYSSIFFIEFKHYMDIYPIGCILKCWDARIHVTYDKWCCRLSAEDKLREHTSYLSFFLHLPNFLQKKFRGDKYEVCTRRGRRGRHLDLTKKMRNAVCYQLCQDLIT